MTDARSVYLVVRYLHAYGWIDMGLEDAIRATCLRNWSSGDDKLALGLRGIRMSFGTVQEAKEAMRAVRRAFTPGLKMKVIP